MCRRLLAAIAALSLGLPFALPAPAAAGDIVIRDDRGVEVRFGAPPRRVVSLLPSLTESVCALGACDRLVGVDRFSNFPAQVRSLPKLGGLEDPLFEPIVALRPDVVLAFRTARVTERLESLGLKVVLFDSQTHADVARSLRTLAQLLGLPGADERLWTAIQREIDAAAGRVPPALRGARVYFEVGAGPYAAGAASFVGETLARLGLVNIVPADMGPFPKLSPEYVVRSRPDIVMGVQRDVEAMRARPGWGALDALEHGRVCAFTLERYDVLNRPGARMGEAAQLLADCLARLGGLS